MSFPFFVSKIPMVPWLTLFAAVALHTGWPWLQRASGRALLQLPPAVVRQCTNLALATQPRKLKRIERLRQRTHALFELAQESDSVAPMRSFELAAFFHRQRVEVLAYSVEVARVVHQLQVGNDAIVAAVLHRTVATTLPVPVVRSTFGPDVATLIRAWTECMNESPCSSVAMAERFMANMETDWRVPFLAVSERLCRLRANEYRVPSPDKLRLAIETDAIFVPLARRLGMWDIQLELGDLALKHANPRAYVEISNHLKLRRTTHADIVKDMQSTLVKMTHELLVDAQISHRTKSIHSIHKKMKRRQLALDEVDDTVAMRVVLVDCDPIHCYVVLGMVQQEWTPLIGRLKDYISRPKPNGYQSLHTIVVVRGVAVEIQIRTEAMHRVAEHGSAAHWRYKKPEFDDFLCCVDAFVNEAVD